MIAMEDEIGCACVLGLLGALTYLLLEHIFG